MLKRLQPQLFWVIEAGVFGLFFMQALRFLIGTLYSRVAGTAALAGLDPTLIQNLPPETVSVNAVSAEVTFLIYMLALPLVTLLLARVRLLLIVGAVLVAVGRALINADTALTPATGAALVVGGGLLYIAMLARHRTRALPYFFVLGLAADQVFRAVGNTLDPSWSPAYVNVQIGLSVVAVLLTHRQPVYTGSRIAGTGRDDLAGSRAAAVVGRGWHRGDALSRTGAAGTSERDRRACRCRLHDLRPDHAGRHAAPHCAGGARRGAKFHRPV
ncbi:MAG: hypothetical protein HC828_15585 [Blastochloris sp.]|nr:hypothetical protein [Blastochloris sp.]